MVFEKEKLAQAAARYSSENIELRAMLVEVEKEIDHALRSSAPAEVLETLLFKVEAINKKYQKGKS